MKNIRLLVSTEELMEILGCGRRRAVKVGQLAEARVEIGHMVRWNVDKLREFLYNEAQ